MTDFDAALSAARSELRALHDRMDEVEAEWIGLAMRVSKFMWEIRLMRYKRETRERVAAWAAEEAEEVAKLEAML